MSHYACRLKILNTQNGTKITFGIQDNNYHYNADINASAVHSDYSNIYYDLNDPHNYQYYCTIDQDAIPSWLRSYIAPVSDSSSAWMDRHRKMWDTEVNKFKKIKQGCVPKNEITLNALKRYESIYPFDVDSVDTMKQNDIVSVSVSCTDKTVTIVNETTDYRFVFNGINQNCSVKMWIRSEGSSTIQILEQYCLAK
eukprot:358137_1